MTHRKYGYRPTYTYAAVMSVVFGIALGVILALVALAIYY